MSTQRNNTILVVDDDPATIESIKNALEKDYKLRVATTGELALKASAVHPPPDLIILDVMMPGIDGYEACRRFKEDPRTTDVPVIFLTAKSDVEDEARGFREGAVDYIHKPISPPILQARVRTHLSLKQARDMLKEQNEHLESLVRKRTAELAKALEAALAASKAKTAFLQTMSHELRTPLNHILGYAEMLEEEMADLPDSIKDLNRIRSSGKHLLTMIDGVLEFARNEGADDLATEESKLSSIIQQAADSCEPAIQNNKNRIEIEVHPADLSVSTDISRLEKVIRELIQNAAKFTNGGRIGVLARAETVADGSSFVIVDVTDTGIGMTPDQLNRCFDAFWQADASTSRNYGGTGMGLASAQQITRQLNGVLTVQSEPGTGSTFTLRLPYL